MASVNTTNENIHSEYGYIKDGKVYLKAYLQFPDREIGQVKTTPQAALSYFADRFTTLEQKIDELLASMASSPNKGSYITKIRHLLNTLGQFDALGNFEPLFARLQVAENELSSLISSNRVKNLEIKRALKGELAEFLSHEVGDWKEASEKMKDFRDKWLKTGAADKEQEEILELEWHELMEGFYAKRKEFFEERQRVMEERIGEYQQVVTSCKVLMHNTTDSAIDKLKALKVLQNQWRDIGPIPKAHFTPLLLEVKRVQKNLKNQLRSALPPRPKTNRPKPLPPMSPEEQKNYDIRQDYIKKAKELQSLDLREAYGKAKELQAEWRTLGEIPAIIKRKVNDDFTMACDRIFEMSYLMRTVFTRHRFFNGKSAIEQFTIKIQLMQEIIDKDLVELKNLTDAYNEIPADNKMSTEGKQLYGRMKTQERKLTVKQTLVAEMQAQLNAL